MNSAPEFLNLFVEPTGEMIYFLAVIAISQATMLMALGHRLRGRSEVAAGRYAILLGGVVLAWLAMGAGGLYALITNTADEAVLPPLERAINALVIVLLSAALLTADNQRRQRGVWRVVALLTVLIIAAYAVTALQWQNAVEDSIFNDHPLGFLWTFVPALGLFISLWLLFTRYKATADIPLKTIFFVALLAGYSYTLIRMRADSLEGHTSGALRLSFLTAVPVVTIIVYRLVLERLNAAIDEVSEYAEAVSRPQAAVPGAGRRTPAEGQAVPRPMTASVSHAESMQLLTAIGLMLDKEDPDLIPRQVAQAIASALKADVVALISHEDQKWADVIAAYDNIQHRNIPGLALNLEEQPTIQEAIERKAQRALFPDRSLDELVDLYTRLDITQIGPAYVQPLTRQGQLISVAIIGMPYTNRELRERETALLEGLAPVAARLISLSRAAQRIRVDAEDEAIKAIVEREGGDALDQQSMVAARHEMRASLELAQQQIGELSRMVRDLQVELDYERSRLAQLLESGDEAMTVSQRIATLSRERQELAAERELLTQALQEAQTALIGATASDDAQVYSTLIDSLRRERDDLQAQKQKLERQLDEVRRQGASGTVPPALRELLEDLSEDKARLALDRDQLKQELDEVYNQLRALGIEGGPLALATTLGQLSEERTYYKSRAEQIAQERDLLKAERARLEESIRRESEREAQIAALESDLKRLATDREALIKQRDTMRQERDELIKARDAWLSHRARLLGEITGLQAELQDVVADLNRSNAALKKATDSRAAVEAERDRLLAQTTALQTERDQLLARIEGNRERLAQLGADGVGTLQHMIEELTTERQQLASALAEAQNQIAQLEHDRSRLPAEGAEHTRPIAPDNAEVIVSIAQELRTPMSAIMGYTDLLVNESVGILGEIQLKFLRRVQANIERLTQLINALVRITQLDSPDFRLQPVTVDLVSVIEDSITSANSQFREKGITLRMNLADHLPPLHADRDAMQQVVTQLLANAYLASPPDSHVTITAEFRPSYVPPIADDVAPVRPPADVLHVSVSDQGGGIPSDEQRRVFGRLYRADNPLIEGVGDTGVGLSIARALVEAHGGTIWLESQPGVGTTFHFILPLARQHAPLQEN